MFRPSDDTLRHSNGRNYASFWSGHTAVPMAAATAAALLLGQSDQSLGWKVAGWAVAPALALVAGLFQMSTANHFPTDIGAGLLAGAAVATTTVWLHGAL
jgi:membrane-associated phospholipid phosphatase